MAEEKIIKAKYIYSENTSSEYITGAFGGFNGVGDFVVNFFFETSALPVDFEIHINDNGIGQDVLIEDVKVDRFVKSQITMNYETMIRIRDWLSHNINDYETNIKVQKDGTKL